MKGIIKEDGENKAKAIFSIGDKYATLAEYLGWREDLKVLIYSQQAMLKRDRNMSQMGINRSAND